MSNHLILPLEPLPPFTPQTPFNRAIMRSVLRMHVRVRVEQVLRLEGLRRAAGVATLESADEGVRDAVYTHAVDPRWNPVGCRTGVIGGRCVRDVPCEVAAAGVRRGIGDLGLSPEE